MTEKQITTEENKGLLRRSSAENYDQETNLPDSETNPLNTLQHQIGNRAVQRLLAQRSSDDPFDLDEETAGRINRERSGGQSLDGNVQAKMSDSTGQDFSDVKVHTSPESHVLNEQLSAKAFTTGPDIFFREGAYDPGSSSGQELLAHELTHVVQQRSGSVGGGGGRMTVNAPGDRYEQEADSVAKAVMSPADAPPVQRQDVPEEEEEVQTKALQRQDVSEGEEEVQTKSIQRQDVPEEEEEVQTMSLQRQEVPEEMLQKQEMDEEDEESK